MSARKQPYNATHALAVLTTDTLVVPKDLLNAATLRFALFPGPQNTHVQVTRCVSAYALRWRDPLAPSAVS